MNQKDRKTILLKVFVFLLLLLAFYGPILSHTISFQTDDLGRHLQNGKAILEGNFDVLWRNYYSYTDQNNPYINDHWLSGIIFFVLYSAFGFSGLVIFKVVLLLATFALIFWVATRRADFWLVAALSIPAIVILLERTNVRPEIFSYFFTAIFLYLLFDLERNPERKKVFWLIPLQLLWVNLHTFFIVGPMLAGGFLVEKIIQQWQGFSRLRTTPPSLIKKLSLLFLALVAVNVANPNGVAGVFHPFFRFGDSPVWVTEDQSLLYILSIKPVEDVSVLLFIPLIFILIASFFFGFRQKGKPIFYCLASVGTATAGFMIVRALPFFGLIFLPAASANFNDIFYVVKSWLPTGWKQGFKIVSICILIAALLFLIVLGIQSKILRYEKFGFGLTPRSADAATFFKEQNLRGPILNGPAIGSSLIWHLFPQERVFFDNRHADAYSPHFVHEVYKSIVTDEEAWREKLAGYHFNTLFFYHYDEIFDTRHFIARRMRDPDWAVVYVDDNAVILLRTNEENKEKIEKFQITKDNVDKKMKYLLESQDVDDWIAAADIFNLMDRGDLALPVYQEVVLKQPKNSKIWRIMGETAILRNNEKSDILAVIYLERAIDLGQKNVGAYTWLGLAYFRLGRFEEAKEMLQKALKLDQNHKDAKEYWQKLQSYLKERKR